MADRQTPDGHRNDGPGYGRERGTGPLPLLDLDHASWRLEVGGVEDSLSLRHVHVIKTRLRLTLHH